MKKLGLLLMSAALLAGCASTPPAAIPPTTAKAAVKELSAAQITTLQDGLRAVDRAAVNGSLDKARAVCAQLADGAHGEGFLRGVALRFEVDQTKAQGVLDAIAAAKVC